MPRFSSSNVESAEYDRRKKQLTITFKGNRKYRYSEVPINRYRGLNRSVSKGRYVNRKIAYQYPYKKIRR